MVACNDKKLSFYCVFFNFSVSTWKQKEGKEKSIEYDAFVHIQNILW